MHVTPMCKEYICGQSLCVLGQPAAAKPDLYSTAFESYSPLTHLVPRATAAAGVDSTLLKHAAPVSSAWPATPLAPVCNF